MAADNSFFDKKEIREPQGFTLDFKRVLARAIRFWYVVILILGVSLAIAFYKTRYSMRVYPVSASILIRETQEMGGAELLYRNSLIDPYRNYLNEPYIIRSYPLIEKVIKELNFQVAFYREGYFMTSEAYSYVPVEARLCSDEARNGQFIFKLVDDDHYKLSRYSGDATENASQEFALGDSVEYEGYQLCIRQIPGRRMSSYFGVPFLLTIREPVAVAAGYISRLKVEWAEQGAGIINLSITGSNPEKEVDFLNQLIATYSEADLDKKNEAATRTIDFIRRELTEIRDSLRTVELQLEKFGNSSRIKDMSAEAQRLYAKLETVEVQKAELMIRQNYFNYLEEYLRVERDRLDQVILPSSMGIDDPIIGSLLSKMVELQLEVRSRIDPEKGMNPLVMQKLDQITTLKKDLGEALRSLRATDRIKTEFLEKQIKSTENQLYALPASERQLIGVQRNYTLLENMYVFLMQKFSEAGISKAANTSDIVRVNPPMRGGAIQPRPAQNYTIAMVIGLLLPFGLFTLFEIINNKVQSKEDIERMSAIPFVGGVGHNTTGNNLTVMERPKSGIAESFRALRSNLNYFTANKEKVAFMVCSSISGEGKTFTTINLATVYALSGKSTLIVGADMRRPKIFEDFGRKNETGLSTYLSGLHQLSDVVQKTDIDNLHMVSGGPVPPNPSELLMTDTFEKFVQEAKAQFDVVIIDTPPLALVTDAFIISKFVDHSVFVLRQNFTPKQFIKSIDEYHSSGKIPSISMLLNDIYKSGLGYGYGQGYAYYYGYSYGYGYGRRSNGHGYYEE